MKEKKGFSSKVSVRWLSLCLAVFGASVFHASRMVWVFFDPAMSFVGGAIGLFVFMLLIVAAALVLLVLRLFEVSSNGKDVCASKAFSVCGMITFVLSVLLAVAGVVILFVNDMQTNVVLWMYLKRDLPVIGLFAAVVLLLALLTSRNKVKSVLAVILCVCLAFAALYGIFPLNPYRVTSSPAVFDTGSDYAVVFATNAPGTGFVEYEKNGETKTVFAQTGGRLVADRLIHSVRVPYADLDGNSYTVGSTRVIEAFSYGSRLGKTVKEGPFTLSAPKGETQSYLVVSDWHSYLKQAYSAISHLGDYDGVILLGDPAAGMDFEEQAVRYLVEFAGQLTGGEKIALYVRGNHETRGAFADKLPSYLGFDQMYYTAERGPFSFVVLDSGEDKPDDHVEYGGLNDFYTARKEMVGWLQTAKVNGTHVLALSHAWQVSEVEPELSRAAWDAMDELGVRFVLSGHMHVCRFLDEPQNEQESTYLDAYPDILTYVDGGHRGKTYIASKITLTGENVRFEAVNQDGESIIERTVEW